MSKTAEHTGNRKTRVTRWAKIIILIYCVIGIAVYYLQDYVILHPQAVSRDTAYEFKQAFKELNIAYDANTNINVVQFTTKIDTPKGVVLYFHGNKNNIGRYAPYAPYFTKSGYEIWMIDYPGFGKSTGKFSEKLVYEWSMVLYNMARRRFASDSIIIYGKSLGTGVAAQLAAIRDCKYLVLETPYFNMPSVAATYLWMYPVGQMIHYRFPTNQYLQKVTAPVIIFHGTSDRTIPYSNAKKLKPLLGKKDKFVTLEGGKHNNLLSYPATRQTLDSLLTH